MDSLLLLGVFVVAVVWLLRRPTAADRALLRQNRDLHDALMSRFEDERDWLSHRRQMEEIAQEQRPEPSLQPPTGTPFYGQAPMEVEEPMEVELPPHGAGPMG